MTLMVKKNALAAGAALLCFAFGANAQTANKVGVISVQGAIVGTRDGQKASQELDAKFAPRKKDFDARQSELASLQDQFNKGGSVLSEDKRNQLARDIDEKKKRLERDTQDAQEELQSEQQRLLQSLGQRMMAVIEKYAKDNNYTLILDVSNPNTPVLYASSGIDITSDIISLYDKNPGPAPSSGTTPNAAAPGATTPRPGAARPAVPGTARPSTPTGK
jgi:outer membrane protein